MTSKPTMSDAFAKAKRDEKSKREDVFNAKSTPGR